ncbi:hypothetical protein QJS10_CPB20g02135 [Acorus calamus]|uniref:Uncharacterized protein n=1 Tax=Acorus calamus TaxID=4465 RepID=A0AAV9CCS4_ACOCL|nr:hypothetical protein QJS10_CPB20g02135 [Acorus calamus]
MRTWIAKYKESLFRIALDVQGAAEDLDSDGSDAIAPSDRRSSHRFAQSTRSDGALAEVFTFPSLFGP